MPPLLYRLFRAVGVTLAVIVSLRAQNWRQDPSFTIPAIESSLDTAIVSGAALPDGRFLLTKTQASVNGQNVADVVRLNGDGSIDPAYKAPAFSGFPHASYVYPDGRALVNDAVGIVRLLPDGTLDSSFVATPYPSTDFIRLVALADGRFLTPGVGGGTPFVMLANGGKDPAYVLPANTQIYVNDAVAQPDGKVVIAGGLQISGLTKSYVFRLNADFSVDQSFDSSKAWPVSASSRAPDVIARLPDGRILTAGGSGFRRLLSDGSPDASYAPATGSLLGTTVRRAGGSGVFYLLAGSDVTRVNAEGVLDPSFHVKSDLGSSLAPVSWDDRTVYFVDPLNTARKGQRLAVSRVTGTGAVDTGFSPRVSRPASIGLLRQPDGRFLVTGFFDYINNTPFPLNNSNFARINADGSLDTGFHPPGNTVLADKETVITLTPVGVQPDGKIIVTEAGGTSRLNPDGSRDSTFVSHGGTVVDPVGRIYVGQSGGYVRYLTDGTLDPTFRTGAVSGGIYPAADGTVVVVQVPTGQSQIILSRLLADGSVDPAYHGYLNAARPGKTVAMASDGSMVIVTDDNTDQAFILTDHISVFDPAGNFVASALVHNDTTEIVTSIHDLLASVRPGKLQLAISLSSIRFGGLALFDGDTCMFVPGFQDPGFPNRRPVARYIPLSSGQRMAPMTPAFAIQPKSWVVSSSNLSPTLYVYAYGRGPVSYQWMKDGIPYGPPDVPALGDSWQSDLTFDMAQPSQAGNYSVVVTTPDGQVTSDSVRLDFLAKPQIQTSPRSLTVRAGQTVALASTATGSISSWRWYREGVLVGATGGVNGAVPELLLSGLSAGTTATWRGDASNSLGTATGQDFTITVVDGADPGQIVNLSVLNHVGPEAPALVTGFVVQAGDSGGSLPLLVRGMGPSLAPLGVSGFLVDPQLEFYNASGLAATSHGWGGDAQLSAVAAAVGAFPFASPSSKDAALYLPGLVPGPYTAHVTSGGNSAGSAIVEVYDANSGSRHGAPRLINVSSRTLIGPGGTLTAGFVISGATAETVLVRGIGSGLKPFGVTGTLAFGELTIFDSAANKVAQDLVPARDSTIATVAQRVGAFALSTTNDDNAILVTLPPGAYTAQFRGVNGLSGNALIEVYEVP